MKKILFVLMLGLIGLTGTANAGGSFSISIPFIVGAPSYPSYPVYSAPAPQPQMCWNAYYNSWQPCSAPAPVYVAPPVYSPGYISYSNGYYEHRHNHHGYRPNYGYGYPGGSASFSYGHHR